MSSRSFRSLFMVASCAGAALGCYLVSLRVASERALDDIDHAIFVAPGDHEPRHAQRPDDDGNERREQHRLERQQAPAQPRAQAIGFVVLAHSSFFKR